MTGRLPGRVRIVAGARRGRYLRVPREEVRPTSELVREAMFNALGSVLGLTVLDLFAGTGALGLEALSRGAKGCQFVEANQAVAAVLQHNISSLEYQPVSSVVVADYRKALETFRGAGKRFDLLFVDPPYRILSEVEAWLAPLVPSLVSKDGVVVIEGERSAEVTLGGVPIFSRVYGDTKVTMVTMKRRNA
jgi:16S rRNA (guanine966-N2)-methyltransferase